MILYMEHAVSPVQGTLIPSHIQPHDPNSGADVCQLTGARFKLSRVLAVTSQGPIELDGGFRDGPFRWP